jgi:hypothetical protein
MRDSRRMTVNYARRQQRRRLRTAASRAAGTAVALAAAMLAAAAGAAGLGSLLALFAIVSALASRRALRLARRSRVGAESEAQVRRALKPLARQGWDVRHAVDWPGRGDLDHVVRSPSGIGFVIETKTPRYRRAHVVRTVDAARWLARKRRRYPCGVRPSCAWRTAGGAIASTKARWSSRWLAWSKPSAGSPEVGRWMRAPSCRHAN